MSRTIATVLLDMSMSSSQRGHVGLHVSLSTKTYKNGPLNIVEVVGGC